jgi:hypothetical protein
MPEYVCTTTIWIDADDFEEAWSKLRAINEKIADEFGCEAASDPTRVNIDFDNVDGFRTTD